MQLMLNLLLFTLLNAVALVTSVFRNKTRGTVQEQAKRSSKCTQTCSYLQSSMRIFSVLRFCKKTLYHLRNLCQTEMIC